MKDILILQFWLIGLFYWYLKIGRLKACGDFQTLKELLLIAILYGGAFLLILEIPYFNKAFLSMKEESDYTLRKLTNYGKYTN